MKINQITFLILIEFAYLCCGHTRLSRKAETKTNEPSTVNTSRNTKIPDVVSVGKKKSRAMPQYSVKTKDPYPHSSFDFSKPYHNDCEAAKKKSEDDTGTNISELSTLEKYKRKHRLRAMNKCLQKTLNQEFVYRDTSKGDSYVNRVNNMSKAKINKFLQKKTLERQNQKNDISHPTLDAPTLALIDELLTVTEQIFYSTIVYVNDNIEFIHTLPESELREIRQMAENLSEVYEILEFLSGCIAATMETQYDDLENDDLISSYMNKLGDAMKIDPKTHTTDDVFGKLDFVKELGPKNVSTNTVIKNAEKSIGSIDSFLNSPNKKSSETDELGLTDLMGNLKDVVVVLSSLNENSKAINNKERNKSKDSSVLIAKENITKDILPQSPTLLDIIYS